MDVLSRLPTSDSTGFPEASRASFCWRRCWPAPSAAMMTACPRSLRRRSSAGSKPPSPCNWNGASGMSTKLASRRARADCAAMNPDSRPMSLTMPMPLGVPTASTCAQPMASVALSTAVSKPKDCGTKLMSLSMVLGMPMMEMRMLRWRTSLAMAEAAFMEPSPPMTKRTLTLSRSSASTISEGSCGPLEEPRSVPPNW